MTTQTVVIAVGFLAAIMWFGCSYRFDFEKKIRRRFKRTEKEPQQIDYVTVYVAPDHRTVDPSFVEHSARSRRHRSEALVG